MSKIVPVAAALRGLVAAALRGLVVVALSGLAACVPAADPVIERPDLYRHFAAAGTDGTMVVADPVAGTAVVVNPARAGTSYLPSSTFKIANTLIALETGAVADVDGEIFPPDGADFLVDGKPLLPPRCRDAIVLRQAFQSSCVPVYQRLARRAGAAAYGDWLRRLDYGNRRADGAAVDQFWLSGALRIDAWRQVDFLSRLALGRLPASAGAQRAVADVMVVERGPAAVLRAKTGYAYAENPRVGWWVGWTERNGRVRVFALNLDMTRADHAAARIEIGKAILRELDAW